MDMGLLLFPSPGGSAAMAQRAEQLGFSSLVFADTQCLTPEVWSQLMLVATVTERIEIGTGVTNPVSRDPAVTASAALGLQVASGGRVVLGIGRGDSSMAKIGRRPAPPAEFELYLTRLRAYLDGEEIDREGTPSRIEWLDGCEVPHVPIEVAATGPKVIDIAARRADHVCFAVGADTERLGECMTRARSHAEAAGRDPDAILVSMMGPVPVAPDEATYRERLGEAAAARDRAPEELEARYAELGIPHNTLSFHLGHLARAGLVVSRKVGRSVIYSAQFDTMNALISFMVRDCCSHEFASFQADETTGNAVIRLSSCCPSQPESESIEEKSS